MKVSSRPSSCGKASTKYGQDFTGNLCERGELPSDPFLVLCERSHRWTGANFVLAHQPLRQTSMVCAPTKSHRWPARRKHIHLHGRLNIRGNPASDQLCGECWEGTVLCETCCLLTCRACSLLGFGEDQDERQQHGQKGEEVQSTKEFYVDARCTGAERVF